MKTDTLRALIHGALTLVMCGLGATLILPGDTFDQSQSWRVIKSGGITEPQCALAFFTIALFGTLGIFPPNRFARLLSIAFLSTAHAVCAGLFFEGSKFGGAIWPYSALAVIGYGLLVFEWRLS